MQFTAIEIVIQEEDLYFKNMHIIVVYIYTHYYNMHVYSIYSSYGSYDSVLIALLPSQKDYLAKFFAITLYEHNAFW